jgi:hypothetical protein
MDILGSTPVLLKLIKKKKRMDSLSRSALNVEGFLMLLSVNGEK